MKTFADRLVRFRELKGFPSQSAFARACGLKPQNVQSWESGVIPERQSAGKIKIAFPDLNLDWLYDATPPMLIDPPSGLNNHNVTDTERMKMEIESKTIEAQYWKDKYLSLFEKNAKGLPK